jgi:hypothetical protein
MHPVAVRPERDWGTMKKHHAWLLSVLSALMFVAPVACSTQDAPGTSAEFKFINNDLLTNYRLAEAAAALDLMEIDPRHDAVESDFLRARLLWMAGPHDRPNVGARRLADQVVARAPTFVNGQRLLGFLDLDDLRFDEAEHRLQIAQKLAPDDPDTWYLAMMVADSRERTSQAEVFAERILATPSTPVEMRAAVLRQRIGVAERADDQARVDRDWERLVALRGGALTVHEYDLLSRRMIFVQGRCEGALTLLRPTFVVPQSRRALALNIAAARVCRAASLANADPAAADALYAEAKTASGESLPGVFDAFAGEKSINLSVLAYLTGKGTDRLSVAPGAHVNALGRQVLRADAANLQVLLDMGLDPNAPGPAAGVQLPLALVVMSRDMLGPKSMDMARLLIAHGADPSRPGLNGRAPNDALTLGRGGPDEQAWAQILVRGQPLRPGQRPFDRRDPEFPTTCNGLCMTISRQRAALIGDFLRMPETRIDGSEGQYRPVNVAVHYYADNPEVYRQIVAQLIAAGANPTLRDPDGRNAFDLLDGLGDAAKADLLPVLDRRPDTGSTP